MRFGPVPVDYNKFRDVYLSFKAGAGPQPCGSAGLGVGGGGCRVRFTATPQPLAPLKPKAPKKGAPAQQVVVVTITPYQAAVIAMVDLPLEAGSPMVGPPPDLNRWQMAAVGYPLWLWAEGNLAPAPVSSTVAGLRVSLDAAMTGISYDLGDGTTISCGRGTKWRRGAVPAGTPSPDCGHVYTKPSLPKGDYTITATTHWSVAWTAGGQAGSIPFTQTASTTLPVGELQVLVR